MLFKFLVMLVSPELQKSSENFVVFLSQNVVNFSVILVSMEKISKNFYYIYSTRCCQF